MTTQIADLLSEYRRQLTEAGCPVPPSSQVFRDQSQATFRHDLLNLGVDPAERDNLVAGLAGFVIGLKPLIQQNYALPLLAQYVGLCEVLLPLLTAPLVEASELPDMSFVESWTLPEQPEDEAAEAVEPEVVMCENCAKVPALFEMPGGAKLCPRCAHQSVVSILTGGRQGFVMPQIGGPGFNRGPDEPVAEVGPKRFWDKTISELLRRKK